MNYEIHWQTKIGGGLAFYSGIEKFELDTDDLEEVTDIATHNIWRRAFTDRPKSHIQITNIESI